MACAQVGAGFLMKASRRFKGECAEVNADQIAAKERAWLDGHGVAHYDYTRLALQYAPLTRSARSTPHVRVLLMCMARAWHVRRYAPLMFDAIHFTYYWVRTCNTHERMHIMHVHAMRVLLGASQPPPAHHAQRARAHVPRAFWARRAH